MGLYELIKSFDVFGANINFYINTEKNYTSFFGGFIFLLYAIICPIYIIICLISFINRNNISVIQYSKELFETENLSFSNDTSSFAVGLQCDDYDDSLGKLGDLFELQFNYIQRIKVNGTIVKNKTTLPLHICTYDDFHKDLKDDLDVNQITTDYYCPDEKNHSIKGIITDEVFSFYELILLTRKDKYKEKYFKVISSYDCKFNLYFSDVSIDVTNITHPINYYLNNIFIQLATIFFKKVDTYFNIKSFKDDENLFYNRPEKTKYLTYVRKELYDVYFGENRYEVKSQDYKKYAKYFIKADKTQTIIERKCEKFAEMVASTASILSGVLLFLRITIELLNYSFATKNILDTLLEERKEYIKKIIIIKNKFQEQQPNYKQSNTIKKIDDSKININQMSQISTLDELSRNNYGAKPKNNMVHNNYDIKNCNIGLKRNNFVNSDINTIDGTNLGNQLVSERKNKNIKNLKVKHSLKNFEDKSDLKDNVLVELNNHYQIKLKTKKKLEVLNYIINESIIMFYLRNLLPFHKNENNNSNEIFLKKSLKELFLRLDVITYLKTFNRLEILFHILFKSSDLNIFNTLSKLNMNKSNEDRIFYDNDKFSERANIDKFINNYIQLLKNKEKNEIEERLQKLIQKEMIEL